MVEGHWNHGEEWLKLNMSLWNQPEVKSTQASAPSQYITECCFPHAGLVRRHVVRMKRSNIWYILVQCHTSLQ